MTQYLIRRTLGAVLVMWAVATLVFFMLRAVPGDPIAAMLFDVGDAAAVAQLRAKFGLDQPVYVQYVKWFVLLLHGDLGNSIYGSRIAVSRIVLEALPRTLSLASLVLLHRRCHRRAGRHDLGDASLQPARPHRHRGCLPRPFDARLLARHSAHHRVCRPPAMAAGHRLRADVARLLALALAPDPAGDRHRHRLLRHHRAHDPLLHAGGAEDRIHAASPAPRACSSGASSWCTPCPTPLSRW